MVTEALLERLRRDGYTTGDVRLGVVKRAGYNEPLVGVFVDGVLDNVYRQRRDGKVQQAIRYATELPLYVEVATPNPKIGPMMEGFASLAKHKRTDLELGNVRVELGKRDDEGDLSLDVLRLMVGRSAVAFAAGEVGRAYGAGLVFCEHNTFVPEKYRGKAYMKRLYLELLHQGATLVSDVWNHSPPMRKTWLSLAREPNVFVFADDDGRAFTNVAGAAYEDPRLDKVLLAVLADDERAAQSKVERVLAEIGTDYSVHALPDHMRFADDGMGED